MFTMWDAYKDAKERLLLIHIFSPCIWAYFVTIGLMLLSLTKIRTNIIWTCVAFPILFLIPVFIWEFYQEYVYAIELNESS